MPHQGGVDPRQVPRSTWEVSREPDWVDPSPTNLKRFNLPCTRWSLKSDSYDRLVCLGVNVAVHTIILQKSKEDPGSDSWPSLFFPGVFSITLLRCASLCLPPSPSAWLGGAGQWAGESPSSTLQVTNKSVITRGIDVQNPSSGFSRKLKSPSSTLQVTHQILESSLKPFK